MDEARTILLAAKIGKKPNEVPPVILQVLNETAADTPITDDDPRSNPKNSDKTAQIDEFFVNFCKGAQIAYERHGYFPKEIMFIWSVEIAGKQPDHMAFYVPEADIVFVQSSLMDQRFFEDGHNFRHCLMADIYPSPNKQENALLIGYEEGWHACEKKNSKIQAQVQKRQAEMDAAPIIVKSWDSQTTEEYESKANETIVAELKRGLIEELRAQTPPITQR